MVKALNATEVWIKPLSDATFAVTVVNKGNTAATVTVLMSDSSNWSDFYPAAFDKAKLRDVFARQDLGVVSDHFDVTVGPLDGVILTVSPI